MCLCSHSSLKSHYIDIWAQVLKDQNRTKGENNILVMHTPLSLTLCLLSCLFLSINGDRNKDINIPIYLSMYLEKEIKN